MNETLILCTAMAAGFLLGSLFFGGLWWTTRKGIASDQPALWFAASLLGRTSFLLAGFYFVSSGDWHRAVACLTGFIIARIALLRLSFGFGRGVVISHKPDKS
jgi:F1F0 ATPase subunit 2